MWSLNIHDLTRKTTSASSKDLYFSISYRPLLGLQIYMVVFGSILFFFFSKICCCFFNYLKKDKEVHV